MVTRAPEGFLVDLEDPRAPSQQVWDAMSETERERVVASLPSSVPAELCPPEGDQHFDARSAARRTLRDHFKGSGRKVYVSSEINVYYPDEPRFSPDVLAVLDVEQRDRSSWIVSKEGKALDFVMEVTWEGDRRKDFEVNVERYARLGIPEYFIFDRARLSLRGYRLPERELAKPARSRRYTPIIPQRGQYASEVLGLNLMLEGDKLHFYFGTARLAEPDEVISRLGVALDSVIEQQHAVQRALAEAEDRLADERQQREEERRAREQAEQRIGDERRAREEERRAREEERRAREEAERKLAEALAELERLKQRL